MQSFFIFFPIIVESLRECDRLADEDRIWPDEISGACIADFSNTIHFFDCIDEDGGVTPHIAYEDLQAASRLVGGYDAVCVLESQSDGFLDQDVLVGFESEDCFGCMKGVIPS